MLNGSMAMHNHAGAGHRGQGTMGVIENGNRLPLPPNQNWYKLIFENQDRYPA
jgi:hypothetical protein